jgi:hypothetical protein
MRYMNKNSEPGWTLEEKQFLKRFIDPWSIQEYLDSISYNPDYGTRSPRWVIKKGSAHCFEGAIFAAAVLDHIGYKPLIVDMKAYNDDDHVIAVFRDGIYWGCVAKSNFTSLRYREPVYLSLRELIMSYFDFFFNTKGEKTLRSYSRPFNLSHFDSRQWRTTDEDLDYVGDKIESIYHYSVVDEIMICKLKLASEPVIKAGLLGSNSAGLFKPK